MPLLKTLAPPGLRLLRPPTNLTPLRAHLTKPTAPLPPTRHRGYTTVHPPSQSTPLLTRQSNRPLPPLHPPIYLRPTFHLPVFLLLSGLTTLLIFNYQHLTSPIITSTLYTLRVSPLAREVLGDEIQLAGRPVTWVHGSMDQFHGKVDIRYWVKGRKGGAWVVFTSEREGGRMGLFRTRVWELRVPLKGGGERVVDLLREGEAPVVE